MNQTAAIGQNLKGHKSFVEIIENFLTKKYNLGVLFP